MRFSFPFWKREDLPPPPFSTAVTPLSVEWNYCDPYIGAITSAGVNPKSIGGARTSQGVLEPRSRKRWKRVLTVPMAAKVSLTASAWEDQSGDGNIMFERQPTSAQSEVVRPRIPGKLRKAEKAVFGDKEDGWDHADDVLTFFDDAQFSKDSFTSLFGRKAALRGALRPAATSRERKWEKRQKRFRVELKREGARQTFSFMSDDNKFGRFTLAVDPNRRIGMSMIVKQAFWDDKLTPRERKVEWRKKRTALKDKIALVQKMRIDAKREAQENEAESKEEAKEKASKQRRVAELQNEAAKLKKSLTVLSQKNPSIKKKGLGAISDVTIKSDAEYRWKDNCYLVNGALEMFNGVLALSLRSNPMRITPKIQLPLGRKGRRSPWVTWVRGPGTGIGEFQVGRRGTELSVDCAAEKVSIKRKQSDGNVSRVSLTKKGVTTVDRTVVTKPVFGNSVATLTMRATNSNPAVALNASLGTPYGVISANATTARSFNVSGDLLREEGRRAYTAGFKLDSSMAVACRVGYYF